MQLSEEVNTITSFSQSSPPFALKPVYDIDCLIDDESKAYYVDKIMKDNNKSNCNNVIYVGDGLTDYYAMEYVKNNGGITIFVYYDEDSYDLIKAKESGVVSYFYKADYSTDSELNKFIKEFVNC